LKLSGLTTLKEFISSNSWQYGAGIRIGNAKKIERIHHLSSIETKIISANEKKEFEKLKLNYTNYAEVKDISVMKFLPTKALTSEGINYDKVQDFPYNYCENFKNTKVYYGPHLLIKEGISKNKLIVDYTESNL